jgi:hypothetical protein
LTPPTVNDGTSAGGGEDSEGQQQLLAPNQIRHLWPAHVGLGTGAAGVRSMIQTMRRLNDVKRSLMRLSVAVRLSARGKTAAMCVWCGAVGCVGILGKGVGADVALASLCLGAALMIRVSR